MKALVLKQPWATLVASGVVDVLQFAKGTDYRGRVLLYAKRTRLSTKEIDATPIEWIDTIENHVSFGNLENHDVTSAFIGFADLVDVTKEHVGSIWAKGGKDSFRWVFANAHIFDHAYPVDIKSSALLVDTPELDGASLPSSHEVELKYPFFEGNELVVPVEDDLECRHLLKHYGYADNFFDLYYSDERLQKLLMGEFKRKKQSFCKTIRLVTPVRTVRFKVVASGLTFDLDGVVKPIVTKEDAKSEFKLFSFELGDMVDMVPPKADAHVLQRCNVDGLFADGITRNALYGIGLPRGRELRLIKAVEGGLGDRSYVAIAWKGGRVICRDDEDIFWQTLSIDSIDGIWHAFLLRYFWTYLPLWWHANYDRREYVYSTKDLQKVVSQERSGEPIENFDPSNYDVTPRIKCRGGNKYVVSACYWTEFGGLIRCELPIELTDHWGNGLFNTLKFGKEKETVLFPYECGICY